MIVNSHGHLDHYYLNECFPHSRILMHEADHGMVSSPDTYLELFGFKALVKDPSFHRYYLNAVGYRTTRINGHIQEGQCIDLGSTRFYIMHLPGHSPGHCGFWFPDHGFIFTVDIDLTKFGPWYGALDCSISDLIRSINRIIEIKPDYLITSHGDGLVKDNISRRLKAYRDIVYERHYRIVQLLYTGHHTIDEIARQVPIYIVLPQPHQVFYVFESMMILKHLENLMALDKVICEDNRYYLRSGLRPATIDLG